MTTQTRIPFSATLPTLLGAGAGVFLASALLISPLAVFADGTDASSTPAIATTTSSDASSTPSTGAGMDPISPIASSTPVDASSTPLTNPSLNFAFSIPVSDPTGDNPIPVTATFSEPVTGFQLSSLNIALGHAANFVQVSPSVYTFDVDVTAPNGTVSIDSNDPGVRDANGDIALAAPQLHVHFDNTLPNYSGNASSTASSTDSGGGTASSTSSGSSTTTPPWILITSGPADGSTISTSTATFTFQTDGISTVSCSFGAITTMYGCGSPQTFTNLVDGFYPFSIYAQYGTTTASTTSSFTVDLEAASSTATSTDTGSDSGTASSTDTTATSTDTTATSTDSSDGDNSSSSGGSTGGTSGQIVYSGGGFGSGSGTSGGSTSGGSTDVVGTNTGDDSVTNTTDTTDTGEDTAGAGTGTNYLATTVTTEDSTAASTTASTSATTDAALGDTSSTSQEAAAGLSGATKAVLWTSLIIVVLALIGGAFWFSRRNA